MQKAITAISNFISPSFKDIEQDKAINLFIKKKYVIMNENEKKNPFYALFKNNEFLIKENNRKKYNSYDKIKNPYINVKIKPIKENSNNLKKNKKNQNNIISIKEEEKNDDQFSSNINNISNFPNKNNFLYISNKNKKIIDDCFIKFFGIKNIGHSCYINSFLQILLRTPYFLKNLKLVKGNNHLVKYLIDLTENPRKDLIIKKIKILMTDVDENYGDNTQSDSQDFGINLINYLISIIKKENIFDDNKDDEDDKDDNNEKNIPILDIEKHKNDEFQKYINKYYKKENEIFIEKMFQFHESKLIIETNDNEKEINKVNRINFETCINMDLSFPYNQKGKYFTLKDLLSNKYPEFHNFYKELSNIENNSINWEKLKDIIYKLYKSFLNSCSKNCRVVSNINQDDENINIKNKIDIFCFRKLASLPNILLISINRAFLGTKLNNSYLSFTDTLDLRDYIDDDILNENDTTYRLYAVNECKGFIKDNGHCYSYIKIKHKWFKFDDNSFFEERPNYMSKYVVGLFYIRNNFNL